MRIPDRDGALGVLSNAWGTTRHVPLHGCIQVGPAGLPNLSSSRRGLGRPAGFEVQDLALLSPPPTMGLGLQG